MLNKQRAGSTRRGIHLGIEVACAVQPYRLKIKNVNFERTIYSLALSHSTARRTKIAEIYPTVTQIVPAEQDPFLKSLHINAFPHNNRPHLQTPDA